MTCLLKLNFSCRLQITYPNLYLLGRDVDFLEVFIYLKEELHGYGEYKQKDKIISFFYYISDLS